CARNGLPLNETRENLGHEDHHHKAGRGSGSERAHVGKNTHRCVDGAHSVHATDRLGLPGHSTNPKHVSKLDGMASLAAPSSDSIAALKSAANFSGSEIPAALAPPSQVSRAASLFSEAQS